MLRTNNNIAKTNHADPEARIYNGKYYIYATKSRPDVQCNNIDCYVSVDGSNWKEIKNIIDMTTYPYVHKCVWAPTIIEKNGMYYLVFASNDIQNDNEYGGIEIAVSDNPEGPFKNYTGKPIIDKFINGAQPIDAHLFKDDDGTIYLYWGGWDHCNVAIMNDDMSGFVPLENGEYFMEFTPENYHEAPCMMKRNNKYYFMFSSGRWGENTYKVEYCVCNSPLKLGGVEGIVVETDNSVAKAPGHNGYFKDVNGQVYIVYHRRPLDKTMRFCRRLAIDKMDFTEDGKIKKVKMTSTN